MVGVTSVVSHTSVDCSDAYALSEFWKGVLGYRDLPDDPNEPGHEECMIEDPATGHRVLFIEVPEGNRSELGAGAKTNSVHFDIRPRTGTRDEEVTRLKALGATEVDIGQGPDASWTVLADPEGNVFCVLNPAG
jgi:hypothetical protein